MNPSPITEIWNRTFRNQLKFFLLLRSEGTQARNSVVKEYLLYLAGKKQEQINRIYEMAACYQDLVKIVQLYNNSRDPHLADFSLFNIYDYAWNQNETDIEYYSDFLRLQADSEIRAFVQRILDMLYDFSAEIKIGYLINTTKELAGISIDEFEADNPDLQTVPAQYSGVAG
jgi:hypothetical protein